MKSFRVALTGLALGALALAPGCARTSETNAGLTNGPPPSMSREKAAERTDLPASGTPSGGEGLGKSGDTQTTAGTAGSGGGAAGADASAKSDEVRANPPAKGSGDTSSAAGGTKPTGDIKEGTPRSPH